MLESKTQKPVQANQALSACENSDELSDNELATVNGGRGGPFHHPAGPFPFIP